MFEQPMKAVLTDERFSDPDWIYERKLDGIRCLAFKGDNDVRLRSRNDLSLNGRFPEVAEALEADPASKLVVDGEVVAFDGAQTSFARLQQRGERPTPVFFCVFDILRADGEDVTALPLRERKALLRRTLKFEDPIRLTAHRNRDGEAFYEEACRKGWEGLIAKRAESRYVGGRSSDWLKFKCVSEQEFVIVGFTDPKGSRAGFGALLIGYHEGGRLRYGGKVGTGFNELMLRELRARLDQLERDTPPVDGQGFPRKGIHWVEPQLVGEVGFTEWTREGQLRHPRFLGLREDKSPREVVRERPAR
jgi:bifunctional non-homologous end joining protein LigD